MISWESTKYSKWYKSHRRFSFTSKYCIELYENEKVIPDSIFKPFLKTLYCHSKSEEKMFQNPVEKERILDEHSKIIPLKDYSNEEKYTLCKDLLVHMKEEEDIIGAGLKCSEV